MKRGVSADSLRTSGDLKIKLPRIPATIVLIGGASASGKTTIAQIVSQRLIDSGVSAKCISMDNFYRSLTQDESGETFNWDSVDAFNIDALLQCINAWKLGSACWIPKHDFSEYKSVERAEYIMPCKVMIIEGIHALSIPVIAAAATLKLFITCDGDEALARRITRDIKDRGYSIDTILTRYFTFVKPALRDVITPSQSRADYIITNANGGETARDNALSLIVNELATNLTRE